MKNMLTKKIFISGLLSIMMCGIFLNIAIDYADAAGTSGNTQFQNPIAAATVDDALQKVLTAVQGIVATLAVLMILVGGVLYITAAGDDGRIKTAKAAVTSAIIGLAIALAAPSFLKEIYSTLGKTAPNTVSGPSLTQITKNVISTLSSFVGILCVIMLVVGGIMYITSAGDSGRTDTAKNIIKGAIIGLIICLLALIIVSDIIKEIFKTAMLYDPGFISHFIYFS